MVLLWPHLLLLLVPRAASLVVVVEACQLLALLGLLQIDWPSGAAGMYVAEGLAALQVFLQAPRLSLLSSSSPSSPSPAPAPSARRWPRRFRSRQARLRIIQARCLQLRQAAKH